MLWLLEFKKTLKINPLLNSIPKSPKSRPPLIPLLTIKKEKKPSEPLAPLLKVMLPLPLLTGWKKLLILKLNSKLRTGPPLLNISVNSLDMNVWMSENKPDFSKMSLLLRTNKMPWSLSKESLIFCLKTPLPTYPLMIRLEPFGVKIKSTFLS